MGTGTGRRLRPIAIICALVMLLWGLFSAASLVAQIQNYNQVDWHFGPTWLVWMDWLSLVSAGIGLFAIIWGGVGIAWRPALHVGAAIALVACGLMVAVHVIELQSIPGIDVTHIVRTYWHGMTWRNDGIEHQWWWFVNDWRVVLALLVVLLWLLVLVTGAGKRRAADDGFALAGAPGLAPFTPPSYAGAAAAQVPAPSFTPSFGSPSGSSLTPEEAAAQAARAVPVIADLATSPFAPAAAAPVATAPEAVEKPEEPVAEEPAAEEPAVVAPTPVTLTPPPTDPPADAAVWFVTVQGVDHGPYTRTQLQSYLDEGRLHAGTITHVAAGEDQRLADVLA